MARVSSFSKVGARIRAGMLAASALMLVASCLPSHAQKAPAFPEKPVRLLVAFPPGGALDAGARTLAKGLTDLWGQSVVVDNKPGAAGILAADLLAHAPPDGYTLGLTGVDVLALIPFLQQGKLPYDSLSDVVPVGLTIAVPLVLVAHPSLKVQNLSQLVALARSQPNGIDYASSGSGSPSHMIVERFQRVAGIAMHHIPYKGAAPAMQDLLAGRVPLMFAPLASALPSVKDGKVVAIAYGSLERSPLLPQVPTIAESGYPKFEGGSLAGIMAPKGTPPSLIDKLSEDVAKVTRSQAYRSSIVPTGNEVRTSTAREFGERIHLEYDRNRTLVRSMEIKPN